MTTQSVRDGIAALQAGDTPRGEQLLRHALQSPDVTGETRAVALMWLATTSLNPQFQLQCYQEAARAAPNNQEIRNRLNELLASVQPPPPAQPLPLPPKPSGTGQLNPSNLPGTGSLNAANLPGTGRLNADTPRMWEFGVQGGENGVGTAFMVVRDGLLATTRYVIGSVTAVALVSRSGQKLRAEVVRSYPEYDLAFLRTGLNVPYLRDTTPSSNISPGMRIIADDYTEQSRTATASRTPKKVSSGWFATTFLANLPRSFDGAPLIDEREDLVGMLTPNIYHDIDRSRILRYGLHISLIRRKIEEFYNELQTQPNTIYCGTCGSRSRAGADGLFYCEICGATFPFAMDQRRTPHPQAHLYYD